MSYRCSACNDTLDTPTDQRHGAHPFCRWATDADWAALAPYLKGTDLGVRVQASGT